MLVYLTSANADISARCTRHEKVPAIERKFITIGRGDNLEQITRTLVDTVQTADTIWLLIVCAHGDAGVMELSDSVMLNPETAKRLAALSSYFNKKGEGIELHGCNMLNDSYGYQTCQSLARSLGVPVYAAKGQQAIDPIGQFEGIVVRFNSDPNKIPYENVTRSFKSRGLIGVWH